MNTWIISKAQAIEHLNMTHEGTLYGLPAWMANVNSDDIKAVPKWYFLRLWPYFADWAFDFAANFIPAGTALESPIRVVRRIA